MMRDDCLITALGSELIFYSRGEERFMSSPLISNKKTTTCPEGTFLCLALFFPVFISHLRHFHPCPHSTNIPERPFKSPFPSEKNRRSGNCSSSSQPMLWLKGLEELEWNQNLRHLRPFNKQNATTFGTAAALSLSQDWFSLCVGRKHKRRHLALKLFLLLLTELAYRLSDSLIGGLLLHVVSPSPIHFCNCRRSPTGWDFTPWALN